MEKKYTFAFTIGAVRDVCERCPDHNIERIGELFSDSDFVEMLDNMAWFISTLNKWSVLKETGSKEGALNIDDILLMDMAEVNDLFGQAMAAFNKDKSGETEIQPSKKTGAVPGSKE